VQLSDKDEAIGAQGIPLTPGRSIAVDKSLHVYGTPFFITGALPIESEKSKTPFHRLMIAQDTGSAIVGPARADLYFGAGAEAGRISGRLKQSIQFVMLVPASLDPVARGRKLPVPDPRPSEKIARLFPQVLPKAVTTDLKRDQSVGQTKGPAAHRSGDQKPAATAQAPAGITASAAPSPAAVAQNAPATSSVPQARPNIDDDQAHLRHRRRHRHERR
jgi:membrane-bound lytic murein transglycosylase A